MEITNAAPEWDEVEDRELWKQFLDTRTGKRLFPKVLEGCPSLLPGGGVNEILIRSGEVRGFQHVLQSLLSLAVIEPPIENQSASGYPALDDDDKWADGQKVHAGEKT